MARRKEIDGQLSFDFTQPAKETARPQKERVTKTVAKSSKQEPKPTPRKLAKVQKSKENTGNVYQQAVALAKERGTAHAGMFMRVFHVSAMESLQMMEKMEKSGLIEANGRIKTEPKAWIAKA